MNPGATPRPTTLLPVLPNWPNPFGNLVPNFVPYPKVPCHPLLPGGEFQLLPLATEDLEDDDKPLLLDDEDLYEDLDQPPPDLDEDVLVLTLNLKRVSISPAIKRMINIIWQNNITTLCFISNFE